MADLKPLFKMAALAGVLVAVRLHIRRGDDVNAIDEKGRTPLMLAASRGHQEVCGLLLDAGANPFTLDAESADALSMANHGGYANVVALLEERIAALQKSVVESPANFPVRPDTSLVREPESQELEEFDLSAWEEDKDTPPPPADSECLGLASTIQNGISAHIPIDMDEDWSDVYFELPGIQGGRKRRNALEDDVRAAVRLLFFLGLQDGCIPQSWVADAALGENGEPDDELERRLSLVLGDLGVAIAEEEWGWRISDIPVIDNEALEIISNDAISFLSDLIGLENDPVRMYMREMGIKDLLTREGEIEIAKRIEEGLKNMVQAISACPLTIAQILDLVAKVEKDGSW